MDVDVGLFLFLSSTIFLMVYLIYSTIKKITNTKALNVIPCEFNENTGVLIVTGKNPRIKDVLTIRNHEVSSYDYVPPSITYTGVTVGGVTTGGIQKTGDYYNSKSYNMNCELIYIIRGGGIKVDKMYMIQKIYLTDSLVAEAKQSNIRDYIDGNYILVVDERKVEHKNSATLAGLGVMDLAMSQASREKAETFPSRGKCNAIINWLSTPSYIYPKAKDIPQEIITPLSQASEEGNYICRECHKRVTEYSVWCPHCNAENSIEHL